MSHALTSETGIVVQCLICLTETDDGITVKVSWRGLPKSEDTLKTIFQIYEYVT